MASKPMTPQEYVDWYNSLPVDDTPLPENYVARLQEENEQLKELWRQFIIADFKGESQRAGDIVDRAAALLANLSADSGESERQPTSPKKLMVNPDTVVNFEGVDLKSGGTLEFPSCLLDEGGGSNETT